MSPSNRFARMIATAAFVPAILFAVSSQPTLASETMAQAAPMTTAPAATKPAPTKAQKIHKASVDRVEEQITVLHAKLKIVPEQEILWGDMAKVMRENGKKMRDGVTERSAKLKTMNAVDDLKSYQMITDEHADGLKRLVPSFEALYAKMSPAQQKNADRVFGEQQRQAARHS